MNCLLLRLQSAPENSIIGRIRNHKPSFQSSFVEVEVSSNLAKTLEYLVFLKLCCFQYFSEQYC